MQIGLPDLLPFTLVLGWLKVGLWVEGAVLLVLNVFLLNGVVLFDVVLLNGIAALLLNGVLLLVPNTLLDGGAPKTLVGCCVVAANGLLVLLVNGVVNGDGCLLCCAWECAKHIGLLSVDCITISSTVKSLSG